MAVSTGFFQYALFVAGCITLAIPLFAIGQRYRTRRHLQEFLDDGRFSVMRERNAQFALVYLLQPLLHYFQALRSDWIRIKDIDNTIMFAISSVLITGLSGMAGGIFLSQSVIFSIPTGILGSYLGFLLYRQIRFQIYADAISKAFPNAVDGLIRCLKAGFDLNRSLTIISTELPRELQIEFNLMIRNRDLGQPLGDAMYFMASRIGNREALFLATLITVQERSGGPLVEALESLSQIVKDRDRLRQKRAVASSEARMSAIILGGLPVSVALLLFTTNPSYRDVLLTTESGRAALAIGAALLIAGGLVMYRMIRMPIT